jgi:hypothetical protein
MDEELGQLCGHCPRDESTFGLQADKLVADQCRTPAVLCHRGMVQLGLQTCNLAVNRLQGGAVGDVDEDLRQRNRLGIRRSVHCTDSSCYCHGFLPEDTPLTYDANDIYHFVHAKLLGHISLYHISVFLGIVIAKVKAAKTLLRTKV